MAITAPPKQAQKIKDSPRRVPGNMTKFSTGKISSQDESDSCNRTSELLLKKSYIRSGIISALSRKRICKESSIDKKFLEVHFLSDITLFGKFDAGLKESIYRAGERP